jgi:hypothetical protein
MVTTRFIGRLGNSMFQVAATLAYAKKYGYQWAVPWDGRESAIHRCFPNLPKTGQNNPNYPKNGYDASEYAYKDLPNAGDNICLAGFFQSEKFFSNAIDDVKSLFKLSYDPQYADYVSIHVRRGDFLQHSAHFPPITATFLQEAIRKFPLGQMFMVFSDDIQWCKQTLVGPQFHFSEGKNELEDLTAMASCKHHIIANSTFSWWAAYLGQNPDRIIVCPHHTDWYGPENGVVVEAKKKGIEPCLDLIPEGWIQIKLK